MSEAKHWAEATLEVGTSVFHYADLRAAAQRFGKRIDRLPRSLRVLLENVLRHADRDEHALHGVEAILGWDPHAQPSHEIGYRPARVILQDFTGVPAVVDFAAMRDAIVELGGDAARINPLQPADLVIDHSVQVDAFGSPEAFGINQDYEYRRNGERYALLRWAQGAFSNFRVVPPGTGIVHQVNIEHLARVVFDGQRNGSRWAWPDTLVGTDSHTTMVNGLGVLGWGVGGIEAEAAMLGQAISMLIPQVVGVRVVGHLPEGATATDAVLTVTQMLRKLGVVGKFVEFFGPAMHELALADRATIANMAPEYGATMGFFPVDDKTLDYLRLTGRDETHVALVEAYAKAQGLFWTPEGDETIEYSTVMEFDLSKVEPSIAGPKRPQDRIALVRARAAWRRTLAQALAPEVIENHVDEEERWEDDGGPPPAPLAEAAARRVPIELNGEQVELGHGAIVIAAITSCTNTSNPATMLAAGLVARKAAARGLRAKPWVKTSLAPGSRVVTDYLRRAGLLDDLEQVGFALVGYGCTTCIGNSGPLPEPVRQAIEEGDLIAAAVLSGNRNFEGRISPWVRANYLASPPLVVAYALAGTMDVDIANQPVAFDAQGQPVYLADLWPTSAEIAEALSTAVDAEQFRTRYASVFEGDERWRSLPVPEGARFAWDPNSTYVRRPPFFEGMGLDVVAPGDIVGARALAVLGDSITTDHISPAGAIAPDSPAGRYLVEHGVKPTEFNSYGSRRGNHEVMMRGTFANIRLRNLMVPGVEGGWTRHLPDGEVMSIFDAAMKYRKEGIPLVVVAGREYGTGSSRDWAAKGPALLGVRAVLAQSFERIHRSNLVGMGILPLEFAPGQSRETLGLTGEEVYTIRGIADGLKPHDQLEVEAVAPDGNRAVFTVTARLDTPLEVEYYRHGGILQYVLRDLAR